MLPIYHLVRGGGRSVRSAGDVPYPDLGTWFYSLAWTRFLPRTDSRVSQGWGKKEGGREGGSECGGERTTEQGRERGIEGEGGVQPFLEPSLSHSFSNVNELQRRLCKHSGLSVFTGPVTVCSLSVFTGPVTVCSLSVFTGPVTVCSLCLPAL